MFLLLNISFIFRLIIVLDLFFFLIDSMFSSYYTLFNNFYQNYLYNIAFSYWEFYLHFVNNILDFAEILKSDLFFSLIHFVMRTFWLVLQRQVFPFLSFKSAHQCIVNHTVFLITHQRNFYFTSKTLFVLEIIRF